MLVRDTIKQILCLLVFFSNTDVTALNSAPTLQTEHGEVQTMLLNNHVGQQKATSTNKWLYTNNKHMACVNQMSEKWKLKEEEKNLYISNRGEICKTIKAICLTPVTFLLFLCFRSADLGTDAGEKLNDKKYKGELLLARLSSI